MGVVACTIGGDARRSTLKAEKTKLGSWALAELGPLRGCESARENVGAFREFRLWPVSFSGAITASSVCECGECVCAWWAWVLSSGGVVWCGCAWLAGYSYASQSGGVLGAETGGCAATATAAAEVGWVFLAVEEHIGVLEGGHWEGVGDVFHLFVVHVEPLSVVVAVGGVVATLGTETMVADGRMDLVLPRLDGDGLVDGDVARQLVAVVGELFQV